MREWQAYFNLEPPARPFALLATILANANRDAEETPEPFTVHDFIQWLEAPFDEVDDTEDDDGDEWDDGTDEEDALGFSAFHEDLPEQSIDEEPAWMQWKRNIRAYAELVAPPTSPTLPPNA